MKHVRGRGRKVVVVAAAPVLGLASAASVAIVEAQPAFALTCSQTFDCTSPSQNVSGCGVAQNSASTQAFTTSSGRYEELRYSSVCRTVWARINKADQGWFNGSSQIFAQRVSGPAGDTIGKSEIGDGAGTKVWTYQLNDAGFLGRACGNHNGVVYCTASF